MYVCTMYVSINLSIYIVYLSIGSWSTCLFNTQLGGVQIRYNNGVTHLTVPNDYEGMLAIVNWLGYVPEREREREDWELPWQPELKIASTSLRKCLALNKIVNVNVSAFT